MSGCPAHTGVGILIIQATETPKEMSELFKIDLSKLPFQNSVIFLSYDEGTT
jgi:hypothetical protein